MAPQRLLGHFRIPRAAILDRGWRGYESPSLVVVGVNAEGSVYAQINWSDDLMVSLLITFLFYYNIFYHLYKCTCRLAVEIFFSFLFQEFR